MATPASSEDPPLRSYELPSSPCRSPTGSDKMSVWVEEVSDGEPRVRFARTEDVMRSPRMASPRATNAADGSTVDPAVVSPVDAPASLSNGNAMEFPLVLVGEARVVDPHSPRHAGKALNAIVPFQKLQMDTNLHQTTLPSSRHSSPTNNRLTSLSDAFHVDRSEDAMTHNFMEAMRMGDIMRPQEPQLSVRLRGSRVELASASEDESVDFLGPAENIKKLFKLPYSQGAVSLAVHRVGGTLVVDGEIDDVELIPGFSDDSDDTNVHGAGSTAATKAIKNDEDELDQQSQRVLYEKFIYQSALAGRLTGHEINPSDATEIVHEQPARAHTKEPTRSTGSSRRQMKNARRKNASANRPQQPGTLPSFASSSHPAPSSTSASRSTAFDRGSPAAFQRVLQWKFDDLKMLLGSDVLLFSNAEHPAVSLRLHDMDKELSLATVLDYYLDNVIANIPELAICMHSKGVVRGYKLVETRQIPYMSGEVSRPLFDVQEVSLNASMLLKFLKNNCTRPNGTYWLYRKQGETSLRLYDVNVLSQGKQLKWKYMMAMLCYRFASRASRMMYSLTVEMPRLQKQLRQRQRDLLRTCVSLLQEIAERGGSNHSSIRSSVAEQLADTYLHEGDEDADSDVENKDNLTPSAKTAALVHAKTYLDESIRLFQECMAAESDATALETEADVVDSQPGEDEHDGDAAGGVGDFMKEELVRLQLKQSSICLQLSLAHLQDENWDAVVDSIRDASKHLVDPPASRTALQDHEVDELLKDIDFDGVKQTQQPFHGPMGSSSRVCVSHADLRCSILEVVGDAASKRPPTTVIASGLETLYQVVSGERADKGTDRPVGYSMRHLAFKAYFQALFPAVDSELYFRLMRKLGNSCNELGKFFLSTTPHYDDAFQWFARGCQVFKDIEDSVNVALLSANLAHLHKILAQQTAASLDDQQQHYELAVQLCVDAASLLKHHKLDEDAELHRKVTGELALSYLVWGVALANSSGPQRESREADAQKKFSKALALYVEIGDAKQAAATHYQIASFHARLISRDISAQVQSSSLKTRLEIARRHYEKALEYFGRVELGPTFVLIHQELADLYAMGGRPDDLDHALLVLLSTVHAFRKQAAQVEAHGKNVAIKLQAVLHQLIRLSSTAAATVAKRSASSSKDLYKRMYKEVIYFTASHESSKAAVDVVPILTALQSMYDAESESA